MSRSDGNDPTAAELPARLERLQLPQDCSPTEWREQLQVATLLEALGRADASATWERIAYLQRHRRPEAEWRTARHVLQRVRRRRSSRRRRRVALGVGVVSLVAVTALLLMQFWPGSASQWRATGDGLQWRSRPTAAWQAVPLGEGRGTGQWRVAGEAPSTLAQAGVVLRLAADTRLRTDASGHPELLRGPLQCRVAPIARGWHLQVGPARVVVHGTVFSLRRAATFTQIMVDEGLVAVTRAPDDATVRLRAGEALRLRADDPLRPCPQDGWYAEVAQAYAAGRWLLDEEWRAGAARRLSLQPGLAVDGVANLQASDDGALCFFTGPDLPAWRGIEVRFAVRGTWLGNDSFCNFFNLGTQSYRPGEVGGPSAQRQSLQQSLDWVDHRVRLIEVGLTSTGRAIYEIEASAGGERYVRAWGQGDGLAFHLELRDLHVQLRDLQVAPLLR